MILPRTYNGDLPPDYVRRGRNGAIYSSHAPGLAVLVLPAFAAFGYPGTVGLVVGLSAVTAALTFLVAWRATRSVSASWFAWVTMLSAPVLLLTNSLFPDSVAPLLVVVGVLPLVEPRARTTRCLPAIGSALTLLPWLHTRLAILAGSLGVVIVARLLGESRRWTRTLAFLAVPLVGAAAWLGFFWAVYGAVDPTTAIGKHPTASLLSEGLVGLFFDQKFGLIVAAPLMVCAFAGVLAGLRTGPRRLAVEGLAIVVPYTLMVAAWDMWWGGYSTPARFLVPIAPVLAVAGALFVARPHSAGVRTGVGVLVALSVLISGSLVWVGRGAMIFADRSDVSPLLAWLSPVVDLSAVLPDAFKSAPHTQLLHGAIWLLAFTVAGAAARAAGEVPSAVAFGVVGQVGVMTIVSVLWTVNRATVTRPFAGGAAVVNQIAGGERQIGVAFRPFTRMPADAVAALIPVARFDAGRSAEPTLATGPLPPGTYALDGSTTMASGLGTLSVRTDRRSPPIETLDLATLQSPRWTQEIAVPVQVPGLRIEPDEAASSSILELTLRLIAPLPRNRQPYPGLEAGHGARYRSAVFYYMGGRSWLEGAGAWVGGGTGAEFAVAADRPGPLRLLVRNGPPPNSVAVDSGKWHMEFGLAPGAERTIDVPATPMLSATPLNVRPATGFRPTDVDRNSRDDRFLGVWIEPVP